MFLGTECRTTVCGNEFVLFAFITISYKGSADCEWSCTNNKYRKSILFKFLTINQTGIFNAVRITNSITCVRHWLSTGIQWKLLWYCSPRNYNRGRSVLYLFMKSLWVAHIWKQHQYIITLRCIAVTTYCNSKIGFKYLILVLEICMVEGSLKVQVFFLKHCPLIVLCIIFQSILNNGIFEVRGVQVENIQNRMVSQHSVNEPQTSI